MESVTVGAPTRGAGFTLIEILIVLVIVGITVAFASVNLLPDDRRILNEEAQKLALLLEQARDEAIVSGKEIAWSAEGGEGRFWRKDELGQWATVSGDGLPPASDLVPGMRVEELNINAVKAEPHERLVFTPSGMNLPFRMVLGLNRNRLGLDGDILGKIELSESDR